jgi:Ser/Thr protein kinase RdoA (MazF antagonist)
MTAGFFSLTPDRVLAAVEAAGHETTGLCWALPSLENRVYEVELEDRRRLVAKFYRPGRWSRETILDEHATLNALSQAEIPVCAPDTFPDGKTLHDTADGILFAVFPRMGGRSPDELSPEQLEELGRLLGRIHNVTASLGLEHRPTLSPATYGSECLATILERAELPPGLRGRYEGAVRQLVDEGTRRWVDVETFAIHADCHKGNLLAGSRGWFFLDFDDMAVGPAAQDFWLLLPARVRDCPREVEALLKGYETMRELDHKTIGLIEVLRGLRYVRYSAWVLQRWEDPSFPRAFPYFGTESYWETQYVDVMEQVRAVAES